MEIFMNTLFLVHLLSGIFWGGVAYLLYFFISPSVRALGPDGGKFMQVLTGKFKLPVWASNIALLNIFSGLVLFWFKYGGDLSIITTKSGFWLVIGMIAGMVAWLLAFFVFQRPAALQVAKLSMAIQKSEGPPAPELLAQMGVEQKKLGFGSMLTMVLLTITIIGMSLGIHL